jgi:hypothetical protein
MAWPPSVLRGDDALQQRRVEEQERGGRRRREHERLTGHERDEGHGGDGDQPVHQREQPEHERRGVPLGQRRQPRPAGQAEHDGGHVAADGPEPLRFVARRRHRR